MTLTKKFDAKVSRILDLVINSIYKNKDIFIRELISNASDACDKLRYESIKSPDLIKNNHKYEISIKIIEEDKKIIIEDTGIGMNKDELIKYLGTIANSGTQNFLKYLCENKSNEMPLIGKFGVGFYSVFMVSEEVKVFSRKAGEVKSFMWRSEGKNEYTIEENNLALQQGTRIELKIKKNEIEYVNSSRIKNIIKTYSEHLSFPINFINEKGNKEIINHISAIWTKNPKEIKREEYENFYSHISYYSDKPWLTLHNKIESVEFNYINLLFIPKNKPFDLFHPDRKTRIKLYINKIFISEENNNLVPTYLRFIRGVVDSSDLPLNINRENLQNNRLVNKIKSLIVKKILNALKKKSIHSENEYMQFFKNFGEVLKEGLYLENIIKEKEMILEICRFQSALNYKYINLDKYIINMLPKQKEIYFLNGEDIEAMRDNPQLEGFLKRKIDVILLPDHIDNFWINSIKFFKNKRLTSIIKNNINLGNISSTQEINNTNDIKSNKSYINLIDIIKKTLNDKIKDVVISSKLVNSPACISISNDGINLRMEKFLKEQKQLYNKAERIFEINPKHIVWVKVIDNINKNTSEEVNSNIINVIYTQACLLEGDTISHPNLFAKQLIKLLERIN